jgi:MFS family permease
LILASVALWYIGYNSVTSKYSVYASTILNIDYNITLIIAQAAAIISYIPVGIVASKIGRKKTILAGIVMLASAFFIGNFISPGVNGIVMYPVFILAGIGWATINVNSFPMVVELAKSGDVGKYTGYYYTASMSAQIAAPILSGFLYDINMRVFFFLFATVFVAASFVTMFFVKHGDSRPEKQGKLESLGADED